MELLEIFESKNIGIEEYKSMCFDNSYFYLLNNNNNYIDKFNYKFDYIATIKLDIEFDFLSFDIEQQCYYALKTDRHITISKLDKYFNIEFSHIMNFNFLPSSFKLCNSSNNLLIGSKNYFFEINKYNFEIVNEYKIRTNEYFFNTKYKNYFLCCSNNLNTPKISLFNESKLIGDVNFKYNTEIVDITVNKNIILILANKNNFSFIFKARLNLKNLSHLENIKNNSNDIYYDYKDYNCYDNNNDYEDHNCCNNNNDYKDYNYCDKDDYEDYNCCDSDDYEDYNCCDKDDYEDYNCCDNDNDCNDDNSNCNDNKKDCCTENSVCEILHSIALIETGIAHILNAEGEKIQKVLECTCDINEILKTNKSVADTIEKITKLEDTLCCKLEAIKNF